MLSISDELGHIVCELLSVGVCHSFAKDEKGILGRRRRPSTERRNTFEGPHLLEPVKLVLDNVTLTW